MTELANALVKEIQFVHPEPGEGCLELFAGGVIWHASCKQKYNDYQNSIMHTREHKRMAQIIYYTKIGCMTSTKQIELLRLSGHEVDVRDLLTQPWQSADLLAYFGDLPVKMWFNLNSPRVKYGEIDPFAYDAAAALELMLGDHLLIRRPLISSGDRKMCGFDPAAIHDWIGLKAPEEALAHSADLQNCSHPVVTSETPVCP